METFSESPGASSLAGKLLGAQPWAFCSAAQIKKNTSLSHSRRHSEEAILLRLVSNQETPGAELTTQQLLMPHDFL